MIKPTPILAVNMITKNEANRYLELVLEHTSKFADIIVVTDDHSTDNTVEIAEKFGCYTFEASENVSFCKDESELRQQSWDNFETIVDEPAWCLALDADERVWGYSYIPQIMDQTRYEVVAMPFYNMWDEIHARIDKAWYPNPCTKLFKYYPGGKFRKRKLACGSEPEYVQELIRQGKFLNPSPLIIEHMGYIRNFDKMDKYKRYQELDGGKFHSGPHLESILDTTVQLIDFRPLRRP